MLSHFKFYRWIRGGRWAKVTGLIFGHHWVRLDPECVERCDEHHRPVFCNGCRFNDHTEAVELCNATGRIETKRSWHHESRSHLGRTLCQVKNQHNDCREFHK